MNERRIWKQEEDRILKNIYEDQGIKKWSKISKIMATVYGIEERDGKQCRDRYHNHLKGGINKDKWTIQEQNLLIKLHDEYGNKWALISRQISGRTESFVKNMLFSKLRRAIRELNQFSYMFYRRQLKQIKIPFIYKLVQFTESVLKKKKNDRNQQDMVALKLKHEILTASFDFNHQLGNQEVLRLKTLVESINSFKKINLQFRGCNGAHKYKLKSIPIKSKNHENSSEREKQEIIENSDQDFIIDFPQALDLSTTFTTEVQSSVNLVFMDNLQSNLSLLYENNELQYPIMLQNFDPCWTPHLQGCNDNVKDWTSGISSWKTFMDYD